MSKNSVIIMMCCVQCMGTFIGTDGLQPAVVETHVEVNILEIHAFESLFLIILHLSQFFRDFD